MITQRHTLILHVAGDTPDLREFNREAHACEAYHRSQGRTVRRSIFTKRATWADARPEAELRIAQAGRGLERLAVLCHGLRGKIMAGWSRATAPTLAALLEHLEAAPDMSIALYACSTGGSEFDDGEGSLADALRDALAARGFKGGRIFAHDNAGHTTRNRMIRILEIGLEAELGERYHAPIVVKPAERELWAGLGHYLSDTPTGRWEAPDLTREELRKRAAALAPSPGS